MTQLKERLQAIIDRAISNQIASSVSLYVGFEPDDAAQNITIHTGNCGFNAKKKTNDDTIYDLASLTKIIATTTSIAKAVGIKKIDLDERPFSTWPDVSIRSLLAHTAGLPAHVKFFKECNLDTKNFLLNKKLIHENLFAIKPGPNKEKIYSDLGFIALGFLLEQRYNKPLDEIFSTDLKTIANCKFSWFKSMPLTFRSENPLVAKTGRCPIRKTQNFAQVHDPNCYFMGGLAGHAGLFGSITQVKKIATFFLRSLKAKNNELQKILGYLIKHELGFMKPNIKGTTRNLSPYAFGHFGYTGTSLWIDPKLFYNKGISIILLTNRTVLGDLSEEIFCLRLAINNAIYKFLSKEQ